MEIAGVLLGVVAGFVAGWMAGYRLGRFASSKHPIVYWGLNVVAMIVGLVGNAAGLVVGYTWLAAASMSFLALALTGLKYGRGAVVGPGSRTAPESAEVELPPLWED